MSSQAKVLSQKQNVSTTAAIVYTSPAGGKGTFVDACDLVNYAGGTPKVTLWIVESGGTRGDVHKQIIDKSVPHTHTIPITELMGRFLAPGSTLHAICDVGASVSIYVTGRELA